MINPPLSISIDLSFSYSLFSPGTNDLWVKLPPIDKMHYRLKLKSEEFMSSD